MAKRKAATRKKTAKRSKSRPAPRRARAAARKSARPRRSAARKKSGSTKAKAKVAAAVPTKRPMLDRQRRTLDDIVPTPPSSLNMDQRGSAARSGRADMADKLRKHGSISPGITSGDVDAD